MTETVYQAYWRECVANAAEDCGATLTAEQVNAIAESVQGGHENYGMAFYSPPASDRIAVIEGEAKARFDRLQAEFDAYRGGAESAIRKALRQYSDANVSISEDGEVFRHNGRTERIL